MWRDVAGEVWVSWTGQSLEEVTVQSSGSIGFGLRGTRHSPAMCWVEDMRAHMPLEDSVGSKDTRCPGVNRHAGFS